MLEHPKLEVFYQQVSGSSQKGPFLIHIPGLALRVPGLPQRLERQRLYLYC
jgi:hypothetical protein